MQLSAAHRKSMTVTVAVALGALLTGCADKDRFATMIGGACEGFERPEYEIKGKTPYDQKWADKQTEAGVAGCNWERPKPRPASLDAKPMPVKAPQPMKPATFRDRWLNRFGKPVS